MLQINKVLKWIAIVLPIIIGVTIRLVGIRHGEPDMVYHPDVAKQTLVAQHVYLDDLNIRKLFHDNCEFTLYPYGTAVIMGNIAKLSEDKVDEDHRWNWALRMRYLSVTFIVLASCAMLTALSKILRPFPLFLTGLLLLTEPVNSQFSHYAMNDVPLLACMLLSLLAACLMPREKSIPAWSILAGLLAGMAFAIKYQGLLVLAFPGMYWLFLLSKRGYKISILSALSIAVAFLAGAIPLSPMFREDPAYFISHFKDFMSWQTNIMQTDTPLTVKIGTNLIALYQFICNRALILLLPAPVLIAVQAWKHRRDIDFIAPIACCVTLAGILLTAVVVSRDMLRENDVLPVLTLLIIATGISTRQVQGKFLLPVYIPAGCLAIIFLTTSTLDSMALTRPDTRLLAANWCDANLTAGDIVAFERYSLPPSREDIKTIRCKFIGDKCSRGLVANRRANVFIISSLSYKRFFNRGLPYFDVETQRVYETLLNDSEVVAEFKDRPMLYAHPHISILKLRSKGE